jgi:hypothetical protein
MKYSVIIFLLMVSLFCKGQTKLVEYNGTADGDWAISSSRLITQEMVHGSECSFTEYFPTSYKLSQIKLLLYRSSTAGTVTVTIREGFVNCPTGTILSTGTANVSAITTSSAGQWVTITMSEHEFFRNVKYYITVSHSLPTATLHWKLHTYVSPCRLYAKVCDTGSPEFSQLTQTIYECWGKPIGILMIDSKYHNKERVRPYGNKYDSKGELYIYDTHN